MDSNRAGKIASLEKSAEDLFVDFDIVANGGVFILNQWFDGDWRQVGKFDSWSKAEDRRDEIIHEFRKYKTRECGKR